MFFIHPDIKKSTGLRISLLGIQLIGPLSIPFIRKPSVPSMSNLMTEMG
jgi:hypothetical protein